MTYSPGWPARVVVATAVFAALAYPCMWAQALCVREGYRLCEMVGVMDPGGSLGGQIMGFNYQREPGWVHGWLWILGSGLAYGPALALALAVGARGVLGRPATLCGRCGRGMRGLREARCPHCGEGFS